MSDPLLRLISGGLKLWLRSRCDHISSLEIELKGTGLGLLSGQLAGVQLTARDVRFQGLPLHHVELHSEAIVVDLQMLKPSRMLALQHPFKVSGSVTFQGSALNQALLVPPWNWLGDWLSEQLMGITPLGGLRIEGNSLELCAPVSGTQTPLQRHFRVNADGGAVVFKSEDEQALATALPMDDNINIEEATLSAGQLVLLGHARVTPKTPMILSDQDIENSGSTKATR